MPPKKKRRYVSNNQTLRKANSECLRKSTRNLNISKKNNTNFVKNCENENVSSKSIELKISEINHNENKPKITNNNNRLRKSTRNLNERKRDKIEISEDKNILTNSIKPKISEINNSEKNTQAISRFTDDNVLKNEINSDKIESESLKDEMFTDPKLFTSSVILKFVESARNLNLFKKEKEIQENADSATLGETFLNCADSVEDIQSSDNTSSILDNSNMEDEQYSLSKKLTLFEDAELNYEYDSDEDDDESVIAKNVYTVNRNVTVPETPKVAVSKDKLCKSANVEPINTANKLVQKTEEKLSTNNYEYNSIKDESTMENNVYTVNRNVTVPKTQNVVISEDKSCNSGKVYPINTANKKVQKTEDKLSNSNFNSFNDDTNTALLKAQNNSSKSKNSIPFDNSVGTTLAEMQTCVEIKEKLRNCCSKTVSICSKSSSRNQWPSDVLEKDSLPITLDNISNYSAASRHSVLVSSEEVENLLDDKKNTLKHNTNRSKESYQEKGRRKRKISDEKIHQPTNFVTEKAIEKTSSAAPVAFKEQGNINNEQLSKYPVLEKPNDGTSCARSKESYQEKGRRKRKISDEKIHQPTNFVTEKAIEKTSSAAPVAFKEQGNIGNEQLSKYPVLEKPNDGTSCARFSSEEIGVNEIMEKRKIVNDWIEHQSFHENILTSPTIIFDNYQKFEEIVNILSNFDNITSKNVNIATLDEFRELSQLINNFSYDLVHEAYEKIFAIDKAYLYDWTFDLFVKKICEFRAQETLIKIIKDIFHVFRESLCDKTPYVNKVINYLEKMGLSFSKAIESILECFGVDNINLCDILLYVIVENKQLERDYHLIEKIISQRKEIIDHIVVENMFYYCIGKQNYELQLKIYNDIIRRQLVKVERLSPGLIDISSDNVANYVETYSKSELSDQVQSVYLEDYIEKQHDKSPKQHSLNSFNPDIHSPEYVRNNSSDTANDLHEYNLTLAAAAKKDNFSNAVQEPQDDADKPLNQFFIDPKYVCNDSLHNLYPHLIVEKGKVLNCHIQDIQDAIFCANGELFLSILKEYEHEIMLEDFILNCFIILRKDKWKTATNFLRLVDAVENIEKNCMKYICIRTTLEVLAMNCLVYISNLLENKNFAEDCKKILLRFKKFQWLSVITSKLWTEKSQEISHMGRYLFLIKLLFQVELFHWAYELLLMENILHPISTWKLQFKPIIDENYRNQVLKLLLTEGIKHMYILNDIYKYIAKFCSKDLKGMEVWKYFNWMITSLIDSDDEKQSELYMLLENIINYFHRYMRRHILRAYFIYMLSEFPDLKIKSKKSLFNVCLDKKVYQFSDVLQNLIIYTNMYHVEIEMIIDYFFENFVSKNRAGFYIEIKLPEDGIQTFPRIIFQSDRSLLAILKSIKLILRRNYNINISSEIQSKIYISKEMCDYF